MVPLLTMATVFMLVALLAIGGLWRDVRADLADATSRVADLQVQVDGLERQAAAEQEEQEGLQQALSAAEGRSDDALADVQALEEALTDRREQLDARERGLDGREVQLDQREDALASRESEQEVASSGGEDTGTSGGGSQPPAAEDFDRGWLVAKSQDAHTDIRSVDRRLQDGIAVAGALYLLSDSYERMSEAGVPPGLDPATYLARLDTLRIFAEQAGDLYDIDPMEASAKYSVTRQQTGVLFGQINGALGTNLQLP